MKKEKINQKIIKDINLNWKQVKFFIILDSVVLFIIVYYIVWNIFK